MSIGLIFWVLMLFAAIFSGWRWSPFVEANRNYFGMSLLFWVLFFLLGWHDFGFIIHQ